MSAKETTRVHIIARVPPPLRDALVKEARRSKRSKTEIIESALQFWLSRKVKTTK